MRIFFSVGEPSGDLHGANLIRELHRRRPDTECVGFGGPRMAAAGCQLHADMTQLAIMWLTRALLNLHRFWGLLQVADKSFRHERPDAVVLIDYPGFNWWVARRAQAHNIPVFYYGTPQIWGWATHRVRKLRKLVNHALCKLPFEPAWYRQHDCQATYVGHPYFDDLDRQVLDYEFIDGLGDVPLVVLMPGSRRQEVTSNLPVFLRTIDYVTQSVPQARFAIASFNDQQATLARKLVAAHAGIAAPTIHVDRTRELIRRSTCCLACSGSVSLELLYEGKPTVIHYRISRVADLTQRMFRRCKYITLVNLLISDQRFDPRSPYDPDDGRYLDEAPYPEYLSCEDRSAGMAHHLVRWLLNPELRRQAVDRLQPLRDEFVKPGASVRAADYILQHVHAHDDVDRGPHFSPVEANVA
jgi:lipid-A-disaccharide synthase